MSDMPAETSFEEQTATRVWLGLLDTDRGTLYFVYVAAKMRKLSNLTNVFITFAASGAVLTALGGVPPFVASILNMFGVSGAVATTLVELSPFVASILNVLVALIAICSRVYGHAEKAATAAAVAKECSALAREWRRLWAEMSRIGGEESFRRCEDLERRSADIVDVVSRGIPLDRSLNQKCAKEAYATVQHEYATS